MTGSYLIGLDFGTASARGVLIDIHSGSQVGSCNHEYKHSTLTTALRGGRALGPGWALQVAPDYLEAAEVILRRLGQERYIAGIGVSFTASSPLPTRVDGTPLSDLAPDEPHAYVKLWKHAAQAQAERITKQRGAYLDNFGGRVSGEWLLAKAAQIADDAPATWAQTERFIEAGDWVVWRLTGQEVRSQSFASFKAQWNERDGYPEHLVPGLGDRLATPVPLGSVAGSLSPAWRMRTGIAGAALIAVAVIDGHVVLPAVGAIEDGTFVGSLGTSAAYLYQGSTFRPLPSGAEGVARDAAVPGFWTYEAGQASFGDTLAWFASTVPEGETLEESLAVHEGAAASLAPGESGLMALDWWNGNRVPFADAQLSGLVLGFRADVPPAAIYRALMEGLCFGTRRILDTFRDNGFPVGRVVMTSGVATRSPLLVQLMADVMSTPIEVPRINNATAVGAAIHGAVAAGVVTDFTEGAARFGAREAQTFEPDVSASRIYADLYTQYCALADDPALRTAMRAIAGIKAALQKDVRT